MKPTFVGRRLIALAPREPLAGADRASVPREGHLTLFISRIGDVHG
jgi:hypothetical protein